MVFFDIAYILRYAYNAITLTSAAASELSGIDKCVPFIYLAPGSVNYTVYKLFLELRKFPVCFNNNMFWCESI